LFRLQVGISSHVHALGVLIVSARSLVFEVKLL